MTKVLLADDERSLCEAVRMILEDAGYEVCVAHDGREAVDVFWREQPDLAILDVMMPKLDGFEVVERIRGMRKDVPVLILSAKGDIVDKKRGFAVGADDYVVKPFDDDEIVLRVGALLRRAAMGAVPADGEATALSPGRNAPAHASGHSWRPHHRSPPLRGDGGWQGSYSHAEGVPDPCPDGRSSR